MFINYLYARLFLKKSLASGVRCRCADDSSVFESEAWRACLAWRFWGLSKGSVGTGQRRALNLLQFERRLSCMSRNVRCFILFNVNGKISNVKKKKRVYACLQLLTPSVSWIHHQHRCCCPFPLSIIFKEKRWRFLYLSKEILMHIATMNRNKINELTWTVMSYRMMMVSSLRYFGFSMTPSLSSSWAPEAPGAHALQGVEPEF